MTLDENGESRRMAGKGKMEEGGEKLTGAAAASSRTLAVSRSSSPPRAPEREEACSVLDSERTRARVRFQGDSEGETSVLRECYFARKGAGLGICVCFHV